MSELKAYCPYANRDGFYHKSEVDKVIAEKDAKILALDTEVAKQKHHAKLFFDERNYAEIQLRHQKYKRCLAMAKWCHTNDQMMSRLYKEACIVKIQGRDSYFFQARWWEKWRKRWLELAEEPTWAKFLQLIHNEASK